MSDLSTPPPVAPESSDAPHWTARHGKPIIFVILTMVAVGAYLALTIPVAVFPETMVRMTKTMGLPWAVRWGRVRGFRRDGRRRRRIRSFFLRVLAGGGGSVSSTFSILFLGGEAFHPPPTPGRPPTTTISPGRTPFNTLGDIVNRDKWAVDCKIDHQHRRAASHREEWRPPMALRLPSVTMAA